MKPTVHDIARSAGVSLATVDRVLNGRPGVRAITQQKVEEAIAALGYIRDVAAANLAKNRTYSFLFILPENENSFMIGLGEEARHAAARSSADRISVQVAAVPPFDAKALVRAFDDVLANKPDGVAFVAVDAPEVSEAVDRLKQAGIAVVTLVSDLSGSRRDHYAGIDNVAAGRTAGSLMGRFLSRQEASVAVLAGSMLVRDHRERLQGFTAVLGEEFPHLSVLPVVEARDDAVVVERVVGELMTKHPDLAGIYSLGAGNRGLVAALRGRRSGGRPVVVAHELTASTRTALSDVLIDAVLNQDAGHEVRSAIRVLKAKVDGQPVLAAQERIRIDIFLKDNLP